MAKSRKDNGDGTVYQVSSSQWKACIVYEQNGESKRKQFSGKTEAAVKKKLREFKKQIATGTAVLSKRTVSEYFDIWLELKKNSIKPLSYRRLESTVDTHIRPSIGFLQFATVDTADVQKLINSMYDKKSHSVIKKVYDALNAIYKYDLGLAPDKRVATYNPCGNVILNRQSAKTTHRLKYFTDEELEKIKAEIKREHPNGKPVYPYGALYLLILNTGMRVGEALALHRAEDIDLKAMTLKIDKNLVTVKDVGGYRLLEQSSPKTSSGNRIISLNEGAKIAIEALIEKFPDTDYIALNGRGYRVSPSNAEKTFASILRACKIDPRGRRCHALRHTFATKLFECGTDVKVVSEILGHSSTRITQDIYISVIQKLKAVAVNKIPNL